jgi:hypothetical protein
MWSLNVFLLLFCCGNATAICTVTDTVACEQVLASAASDFSCSNDDECWALLAAQFVAITPVDLASVHEQQLRSLRATWFDSGMTLSLLTASEVFASFLSFARLPSSFLLANASFFDAKVEFQKLDEYCGQTWSITNCDESGCPPTNATCAREIDFVSQIREFLRLRVFYALRRERSHLFRLIASCQVQSFDLCSDFVSSRLLESAVLLAANKPNFTGA